MSACIFSGDRAVSLSSLVLLMPRILFQSSFPVTPLVELYSTYRSTSIFEMIGQYDFLCRPSHTLCADAAISS